VALRTPSYPLLTPKQRAAHPPQYQPLVYADPHTVGRCRTSSLGGKPSCPEPLGGIGEACDDSECLEL